MSEGDRGAKSKWLACVVHLKISQVTYASSNSLYHTHQFGVVFVHCRVDNVQFGIHVSCSARLQQDGVADVIFLLCWTWRLDLDRTYNYAHHTWGENNNWRDLGLNRVHVCECAFWLVPYASMHVCVRAGMYVCVLVCVWKACRLKCICIYAFVCVRVCMFVCLHVCKCACWLIHLSMCVFVWGCVCLCACMCVKKHVDSCVYAYMHVCMRAGVYIYQPVCLYLQGQQRKEVRELRYSKKWQTNMYIPH